MKDSWQQPEKILKKAESKAETATGLGGYGEGMEHFPPGLL